MVDHSLEVQGPGPLAAHNDIASVSQKVPGGDAARHAVITILEIVLRKGERPYRKILTSSHPSEEKRRPPGECHRAIRRSCKRIDEWPHRSRTGGSREAEPDWKRGNTGSGGVVAGIETRTTPEGSQRLAGGRAKLYHRGGDGDDNVNTMAQMTPEGVAAISRWSSAAGPPAAGR